MKQISLSIFFPAYNEEANIRETVEKTIRVVGESPWVSDYEIIIVNDGSSDRTRQTAEQLAQAHPNVRLINHDTNKGYGAALLSGMQAATKEYVFFTDADLQFDILELQNLLVHVPDYEVVIGYRAPRRDPLMRLLNAKVWNALNRALFGLRVTDIDCAFKLFKRKLIERLPLRSRGAMISAELLIRLKRSAVRIKEIPVTHLPRKSGSPTGAKPSVIIKALREMVSLYRGELGLVTQKEALRFMTVGVFNTLLDFFGYIALTRATLYFSEHLVIAKFLSFMLGTVSSLMLNRHWTFGLRSRLSLAELARFYTTVSISVVINVAVMNVLVGAGMYDLLALVIATGITFAANFTLSKFWVFRKESERKMVRLYR